VRLLAPTLIAVVLGLISVACSGDTAEQKQTAFCDGVARLRADVGQIQQAVNTANRESLAAAVGTANTDLARLDDTADDTDTVANQRLTQALSDIETTLMNDGREHLTRGLDEAVSMDLAAMNQELDRLDQYNQCSDRPVQARDAQ
jgi:hypothetical protein